MNSADCQVFINRTRASQSSGQSNTESMFASTYAAKFGCNHVGNKLEATGFKSQVRRCLRRIGGSLNQRNLFRASGGNFDNASFVSRTTLSCLESTCFQIMTFAAVFLSAIVVALRLDLPEMSGTWNIVDACLISFFFIETVSKLCVLGRRFFNDGWSIFDLTLLLVNLVDLLEIFQTGANVVVLRILRGMKVCRFVRFWKVFPELGRTCGVVSNTMRGMIWSICLLVICLYTASILLTIAFRDTASIYPGYSDLEEEWSPIVEFNPLMYFGSVLNSLYTLFNLALLTEFNEFARAIWIKQPAILVMLAVFTCCVLFGMQHFIFITCVKSFSDAEKKVANEQQVVTEMHRLKTLEELCDMFFDRDIDQQEVLTEAQVSDVLQDEDARNKMISLNFPVDFNSKEFFNLLDDTGTGMLPHAHVVRNVVRLTSCSNNPFEWQCLSTLAFNQISSRLLKIEELLKQSGFCETPPPFMWDHSDVVRKAVQANSSESEKVELQDHETSRTRGAELAEPACTPYPAVTPGLEEKLLHMISESLEGSLERIVHLLLNIHESSGPHDHSVVDSGNTSADLCEHGTEPGQILITSSAYNLQSAGSMQDPTVVVSSRSAAPLRSTSEELNTGCTQCQNGSPLHTDSTRQKKRRKKQEQMSTSPKKSASRTHAPSWFTSLSHAKMTVPL